MSSSRWITSIAVCLLLLQVGLTGPIAELSNFDQSLGAGSAPQANDESTSQNGNGSIKTSYWVGQQSTSGIHDSYLAAASPNSNFGSSEELKIGFSTNASQRWNSVIGFSGYPPNLPSNVTIQSASLALNIKQMSGQPTIRSWMGYSNWDASTTTWNSWNSGGALGNQDSGGLMDEVTITNQSGWVELDITRSIQAGYEQFRLTGSTSPTVVLTGDAWGEDWSIFHSSDYVFESERPR
ncbi:MAG: DNRLRE domain-containing protein, partial [Euryarchaeota archaeon]|nr:DNRLRE domain-containing protein [Euryarchaeota archaeon]